MSGSIPILERYVAKIDRSRQLSDAGRAALLGLPTLAKSYRPNHDIVREKERTQRACLVETGLVSRYRTLRNGDRQILSFHVPADMVDLSSALVTVADHGIRSHGPVTIVSIAHADLLGVADAFPDVARALWFDTLMDAAIFREWTINVGRRNSRQRTAHLVLELATRLKAVGLLVDDGFEFPVNQTDFADALAITPVHLNRTLQWLRGERYIRTHGRLVEIENWPAMIDLAGFDPTYLHPEGLRQFSAGATAVLV